MVTVVNVINVNTRRRRSLQGVISKVISKGFNELLKPLFIRKSDRVNLCPLFEVRNATCEVLGRNMEELTLTKNIDNNT